jgi:hypothetical protein
MTTITVTTTRLIPRERVEATGVICDTTTVSLGGSPVYRCVLATDSGDVDLLFLGRTAIAGLTLGTRCDIQGTVIVHGGRLAVWNPRYRLLP